MSRDKVSHLCVTVELWSIVMQSQCPLSRDEVRHVCVMEVDYVTLNSCLVTENHSPPPPAPPDALVEPPLIEPETEPPPADAPPDELLPLVVVVCVT